MSDLTSNTYRNLKQQQIIPSLKKHHLPNHSPDENMNGK